MNTLLSERSETIHPTQEIVIFIPILLNKITNDILVLFEYYYSCCLASCLSRAVSTGAELGCWVLYFTRNEHLSVLPPPLIVYTDRCNIARCFLQSLAMHCVTGHRQKFTAA